MGKKYLIDTNTISHIFTNKINEKGKDFLKSVLINDFYTSIIVRIELLTYFDDSKDVTKYVVKLLSKSITIGLEDSIAEQAILLRQKHKKLKLGDAIIAATCIKYNLTLVSNNIKDFENIKSLKVLDPNNL